MIALPPLLLGAVEAETPVAPEAGVTLVTVGGAFGVTAVEGDEAGPVPTASGTHVP